MFSSDKTRHKLSQHIDHISHIDHLDLVSISDLFYDGSSLLLGRAHGLPPVDAALASFSLHYSHTTSYVN